MSLVHGESAPCAIDQLELFRTQPTCSQVAQSVTVPHYVINALDSSTQVLEFLVQGSGDQYIDLAKTKLHVKFRVKLNGVNLDATHINVAPLANFLGSMFQQCDIFLNDKCITSSNNLYAHRAYMEQLLNYSKETADAQLSSMLFYRDEAEKFESGANTGFKARNEQVMDGRLT